MYRNKSDRALIDATISAALGAGIVTSFAIAIGQHPAIAISITLVATILAIVCYQFDLV